MRANFNIYGMGRRDKRVSRRDSDVEGAWAPFTPADPFFARAAAFALIISSGDVLRPSSDKSARNLIVDVGKIPPGASKR
jgi:hypothetical protein